MDIVLVAGLWLDESVWGDVAEAIAERGHRPVPVALPGQGDGNTSATLADQVAAVVAAVDAAQSPPMVVGHSAACSLAWLAADARPDRVAAVAQIGGFPTPDGEPYADVFPVTDGVMPFPGWEPFEGPNIVDLDVDTRRRLAATANPVPEGVSKAVVRLTDERRFDVPLLVVCPEFTAKDAQEWADAGELPEVTRASSVTYVDIDTGHWPMVTAPTALADLLVDAAEKL